MLIVIYFWSWRWINCTCKLQLAIDFLHFLWMAKLLLKTDILPKSWKSTFLKHLLIWTIFLLVFCQCHNFIQDIPCILNPFRINLSGTYRITSVSVLPYLHFSACRSFPLYPAALEGQTLSDYFVQRLPPRHKCILRLPPAPIVFS